MLFSIESSDDIIAAINATNIRPAIPGGSNFFINIGITVSPSSIPVPYRARAISPGVTTSTGMNALKPAAKSIDALACHSFLADRVRWMMVWLPTK